MESPFREESLVPLYNMVVTMEENSGLTVAQQWLSQKDTGRGNTPRSPAAVSAHLALPRTRWVHLLQHRVPGLRGLCPTDPELREDGSHMLPDSAQSTPNTHTVPGAWQEGSDC